MGFYLQISQHYHHLVLYTGVYFYVTVFTCVYFYVTVFACVYVYVTVFACVYFSFVNISVVLNWSCLVNVTYWTGLDQTLKLVINRHATFLYNQAQHHSVPVPCIYLLLAVAVSSDWNTWTCWEESLSSKSSVRSLQPLPLWRRGSYLLEGAWLTWNRYTLTKYLCEGVDGQ